MRSMLGFPDVLEEWNQNFQFSCAKLLWIGPHRTTFRKLGQSADHTTLQDSGENFNQVQVPVKQKRCSFKTSQPECFAHSELFAIATKTSNEDTRRAPHAGLLVGPQQLLTTWVMSTGWCRSRQDAILGLIWLSLGSSWLFLTSILASNSRNIWCCSSEKLDEKYSGGTPKWACRKDEFNSSINIYKIL